jgi:hypothetical protein
MLSFRAISFQERYLLRREPLSLLPISRPGDGTGLQPRDSCPLRVPFPPASTWNEGNVSVPSSLLNDRNVSRAGNGRGLPQLQPWPSRRPSARSLGKGFSPVPTSHLKTAGNRKIRINERRFFSRHFRLRSVWTVGCTGFLEALACRPMWTRAKGRTEGS